MNCPACREPVDPEADLCLSCGEPLSAPRAAAPPRATAVPAPPPRASAAPASRRPRRDPDEETVRCRGCGVPNPTDRERCRSCGDPLRRD